MHPDQQRRVASLVRLACHGVDAADPLVDLLYPHRRRAGRGAVAVGGGQHVGGGGGEPARRVVTPLAVLVDAGHRERVQRLQQQRPEPGDRHGQVRVQPPGDTARAEEAVVGGFDRDAGGERRRGALEQPGPWEHLGRFFPTPTRPLPADPTKAPRFPYRQTYLACPAPGRQPVAALVVPAGTQRIVNWLTL